MAIAKINLHTKTSQHEALKAMLKQELHAAEIAYDYDAKLVKSGFAPKRQLLASESKLLLLQRAMK